MGEHLIDGEFQSDKYPTTPRGKVPLSCKDAMAQDLLWEYAQRRRMVDAEFSADLEQALRNAGYAPPAPKLTDLTWPDGRPKVAPVQGYSQGIPWSLHLKAYDAYCKRYGRQDALIDLKGRGCRGGFGIGELDMFVPGWRDEVEELALLRKRAETAEASLRDLEAKVRAK